MSRSCEKWPYYHTTGLPERNRRHLYGHRAPVTVDKPTNFISRTVSETNEGNQVVQRVLGERLPTNCASPTAATCYQHVSVRPTAWLRLPSQARSSRRTLVREAQDQEVGGEVGGVAWLADSDERAACQRSGRRPAN